MKKRKLRKAVIILVTSLAVIAGTALIALFLISGVFQHRNYIDPWNQKYADRFSDPRVQLAAHGLLAGSGHNMQPWMIRQDTDDPMTFELYADGSRMSRAVDPEARQFMVSQGAFLGYLEVAGREKGYRPRISLLPDGPFDEHHLAASLKEKPVARITLEPSDPEHTSLYDALFLPDTNRGAYKKEQITAAQVRAVERAAQETGMTVNVYQQPADLEKLGSYAIRAAAVESGVDRVMKESEEIFRANEYQKNTHRDGFSVEGQGTTGIMRHLIQGLVTLFPSMNRGKAASERFVTSAKASVAGTSAYVMITTQDNSRESQIKSGISYSRLILAAHNQGLAVQPLSQALEEYPEMHELYSGIHEDYAPDGGTIQMLLRIGKPEKQAPLSMRRDVMDLIASDE